MVDSTPMQVLDEETLSILRCPVTRSKLRLENGFLIGEVGGLRYPVRNGIPVLLAEEAALPAGIESLDAFRARFGVR
ncbi:MAG: Trm112 family protein [Tepidisphaeraceae bacterium]|jgi:uncharacterized protein YbaR (Trm112 family)